jgi:sarcosine oxidase
VTRSSFEYIVLGLGGLGSGAAYWLSRRAGADVLGIEQFECGHVRGESEDHSRIIRYSYHTPGYVELAKRAYDAWGIVGAENGAPVVLRTGGLDVWPSGSIIPIETYTTSMQAAGIPYEQLDADEIMRRWPQWTLRGDEQGLFQADGGIAMAARATAAHQKLARAHGATLIERAPVTGIRADAGEVEVDVGGTTYRGRELVITAGPWSNTALGHLGVHLPLEVTQEQVTYFAPRDVAAFQPERFPVWIWMADPCFYGFPIFGEAGTKAARDAGGRPVTAESRSFEPDREAVGAVEDFLARYLPGARGPELYTKTCLYTLTPDRDFVIDAVPGHANVHVAIGAGHAFKFASAIGRILSEVAIDGWTPSDLAPFAIDRRILTMANPPKSYMV